MRASSSHVLTASVMLLVAGFLRCGETATNDDGGTDAAPDADLTGTAGHACFANQTCFSPLTCVSNVCVDLSTLDGGTDAAADASDSGPDVADASDASTVQPILQWSFENNGNNTGSTSGYALSLHGATSYVSGKLGQAAQFGSGAYASVAGMKGVLAIYAQYTISFWLYVDAPNASNAFFDFENRTTAPYGGVQIAYPSASTFSFCVASTSNPYISGSCASSTGPATASWHNVILSYAGTGTGAGQGAALDVFVDDVLAKTIANDTANDPIFSSGISDTLYVGAPGFTLDEIRIYATTFTQDLQCTTVIGGTWNGSSCTLP